MPRPTDDPGLRDRIPPGQYLTTAFPVLHYGEAPPIDLVSWRLRVFGLVEQSIELTYEELRSLPATTVVADIHCVTRWSKLDTRWQGVRFRDVAQLARPRPEARFVMAHCAGGYTTNLPLAVLLERDVLLSYRYDDAELTSEHGWPLRLVVPQKYFWKSAKWLSGLELLAEDSPGFWERAGYNNDADPWKEERYA